MQFYIMMLGWQSGIENSRSYLLSHV